MNAEKINYVYIGSVLFVLGCYGSLDWWQLKNYSVVLLGVLLVLLVSLRLKSLRKFWSVSVCMIFFLLGAWAGETYSVNDHHKLLPIVTICRNGHKIN